MLLMQMSMLVVLMLLPGYHSWSVYAVLFSCKYSMVCDNCSETRTFKIVFQILGCRNDKRSVLLLFLLNRHIQLQITAVARLLFRRENTFDFAGGRGGGIDVVV